MNLFDQVSNDIKSAMLAKDKVKLEALRGIKKEFLEAKTAKGADGELSDEVAMKILAKMVKQRKERVLKSIPSKIVPTWPNPTWPKPLSSKLICPNK